MKQKFFITLNALMSLLFLISAILQWNDPDPLPWISVYTWSAINCLGYFWLRNKYLNHSYLGLILVSLIWSGFLIFEINHTVTMTELFQTMQVDKPWIEIAREIGGLWIVAFWQLILLFAFKKKTTKKL